MEELYVIESGVKRRAEKFSCQQCNSEFLRRLNGCKRFCSTKCATENRKRQVDLVCHRCNKSFKKVKSKLNTKHKIYFCSRSCKDAEQSLDGTTVSIRPAHYGNGTRLGNVKIYFRKYAKNGCEGCGECRRYLLLVHHKDRNRDNNQFSNLEIVCGNCHMKRHLKLDNGKWVFDPHILTPRDMLDKL